MANPFFEHPILNSPYDCPQRHWELDAQGQPTQQIIENRRRAEFITPIPKPKKRKGSVVQQSFVFDEGKGLSTQEQQYDPTSANISRVRKQVELWRSLHNLCQRDGYPAKRLPLPDRMDRPLHGNTPLLSLRGAECKAHDC